MSDGTDDTEAANTDDTGGGSAPEGDEVADHLDRVEEEKLAEVDVDAEDRQDPEDVNLDEEAPTG